MRHGVGVGVLTCLIALGASSVHDIATEPRMPRDLRAMDEQGQLTVSERYETQRADICQDLRSVISDANASPTSKAMSLWYLGYYNDEQAAELLIDQIDFSPPIGRITVQTMWHTLPAVKALGRIGRPAVPGILNKLATGQGRTCEHCLRALWAIDGTAAMVELEIRQAMEAERDPAKRAGFERSIDMLKTLPETQSFVPKSERATEPG